MMLGGIGAGSVLMHFLGWDPLIGSVRDLTIWLAGFSILGAFEFKTLRRMPTYRELTYRDKHGKWRWER